jgi:predicted flap endonuclease-1-like 5' DNA nuclease
MQRPTNNQFGILCVCVGGAFLIFVVYFRLIAGNGFISAALSSLIVAMIIAAMIFLFLMTSHGKEFAGTAVARATGVAKVARAKLDEATSNRELGVSETVRNTASNAKSWLSGSVLRSGAPEEEVTAAPMSSSAPSRAAAPEIVQEKTSDEEGAISRPTGIEAPMGNQADDLKKIKGVGPKLEKLLNEMGYFHFDQIAAWSEPEVVWVDQNLKSFKGRASRDNWVEQARAFRSE